MIQIQTGEISNGSKRLEWFRRLGWGRCFVVRPIAPFEAEPFFVDNGAFRAFRAGELNDEPAWIRRVDRYAWTDDFGAPDYVPSPSFAVIPDVVGDGEATLESVRYYMDEERRATDEELPSWWSWYLAVQDGMTVDQVRELLEDLRDYWEGDRERTHAERSYYLRLDGLFVGGSKEFKDTAAAWAELAHEYGLRCHFGRASGLAGLRAAIAAGCDSCDSAAILFSDLKFFRYAQVWLEEGVEDPDPELVAWVAENVERAKLEERARRRERRAA